MGGGRTGAGGLLNEMTEVCEIIISFDTQSKGGGASWMLWCDRLVQPLEQEDDCTFLVVIDGV